jgi:DNA-binding NarL/FixJ family response regulator
MLERMIRVAVLDRQPAVRTGVEAMLAAARGMSAAGQRLYASDPDVVVLDELALIRRVRGEAPRARILLYAANPSPDLVMAAAVAGADGVVDKAGDDLLAAIREVARGARVLPEVGLHEQARAARRLDPRDRPIFAMRLAGTSPREIATVVGVGVAALNGRIQAIAAQLAPVTAGAARPA